MPATLQDLSVAARHKLMLEAQIAAKQKEVEELQKDVKIIEEETIPEAMRELGLKKYELNTGEKVELKETINSALTIGEKPAAYNWLANNNYGGLIKVKIEVAFSRNQRDDAIVLYTLLSSGIRNIDDLRNALGDEKAELKDILSKFLKTEYDTTIKEEVHHQTLSSFLKERLKEDDPDFPMEEVFKARPITKAVIKLSK